MRNVIFCLLFAVLAATVAQAADDSVRGRCIACHREISPGIYQQWARSEHALQDVSCTDCHQADKGEPDAYLHEGSYIATLVTPKDCGQCHDHEAGQFMPSHHAKAGQILESNDAYLAHVVGGNPAAIAGCESCHGSVIKTDAASPNRLPKGTWPNSGIGRINPDGSLGACNACHLRHEFSRAQARQPQTCGKCHLGPDHPQKEIYEESKHGIVYATNVDKMNLSAKRWVVGEDYDAAPTCATCHVSQTRKQPVTHDMGTRISWTLRPEISKHTDNWTGKRKAMQEVCSACHGPVWVAGHYTQMDGLVNLYDEKFARPAGEMMKMIRTNKSLKNPASFSNDIEWTYWELWHHEGRRARHGAAMMGPDYTWWHGIYEVGKHFYFEFIPEVRETGDQQAIAYADSLLKNDPMHNWLSKPTDELRQAIRTGKLQALYKDYFQPEMGKK